MQTTMPIENQLPIIIIVGIISLYFLATGITGLIRQRMRVLNPMANRHPLTVMDAVMNLLKTKVESDYPVPDGFIDRSHQIEISGKGALIRSWLHILLGLVAGAVLILFLNPGITDGIMALIY